MNRSPNPWHRMCTIKYSGSMINAFVPFILLQLSEIGNARQFLVAEVHRIPNEEPTLTAIRLPIHRSNCDFYWKVFTNDIPARSQSLLIYARVTAFTGGCTQYLDRPAKRRYTVPTQRGITHHLSSPHHEEVVVIGEVYAFSYVKEQTLENCQVVYEVLSSSVITRLLKLNAMVSVEWDGNKNWNVYLTEKESFAAQNHFPRLTVSDSTKALVIGPIEGIVVCNEQAGPSSAPDAGIATVSFDHSDRWTHVPSEVYKKIMDRLRDFHIQEKTAPSLSKLLFPNDPMYSCKELVNMVMPSFKITFGGTTVLQFTMDHFIVKEPSQPINCYIAIKTSHTLDSPNWTFGGQFLRFHAMKFAKTGRHGENIGFTVDRLN